MNDPKACLYCGRRHLDVPLPDCPPRRKWKCTGCGRFVAAASVSTAGLRRIDGSSERRGDCATCGNVEVW